MWISTVDEFTSILLWEVSDSNAGFQFAILGTKIYTRGWPMMAHSLFLPVKLYWLTAMPHTDVASAAMWPQLKTIVQL